MIFRTQNKIHVYRIRESSNIVQGDQKVSVLLMIVLKSSGAQRLFDHPVQVM